MGEDGELRAHRGGEPLSNTGSAGEAGPAASRSAASNSSRLPLLGPSPTSTMVSNQCTKARTACSSSCAGGSKRSSSRKASAMRDGAIVSASLRQGSPGMGRASVSHSAKHSTT